MFDACLISMPTLQNEELYDGSRTENNEETEALIETNFHVSDFNFHQQFFPAHSPDHIETRSFFADDASSASDSTRFNSGTNLSPSVENDLVERRIELNNLHSSPSEISSNVLSNEVLQDLQLRTLELGEERRNSAENSDGGTNATDPDPSIIWTAPQTLHRTSNPYLYCSNRIVRRNWIFASLSIIVVISALIGLSLRKVATNEYGVKYDIYSKTLASSSLSGGLYFGPIGYRFIKIPSTQISTEVKDTCVSRDGLRLEIHVVYQYKVDEEWIVDLITKYRDYDKWSQLIHAAGKSAIHHSCSSWNVNDFQARRLAVQNSMFSNLRLKLEGVNAELNKTTLFARPTSLQLNYVGLPIEYKNAVAEKQRAEEDIALAKNERSQKLTRETTELKAAEKKAYMVLDRAYNDANVTFTLAKYRANQTLHRFDSETQVLTQAQTFLDLNPNGIISYVANKVFEGNSNLKASFGEPAQISRKNLLSSTE